MNAANMLLQAAPQTTTTLGLVERMGRDRALSLHELGDLRGKALAAAPKLWAVYEEHWRRFCGARLDPQFWQLDHPSRQTGQVKVSDGSPVVIVGTGPSLRAMLPELRRVRASVQLFTSPRGAEALAEAGLRADLVLVEHQTPLDAMFTVSDLAHRDLTGMRRARLVAATANTPAKLLTGISQDSLFVPEPLPTWGLWPATAAALALASGTHAVALLGIDLGTNLRPDPAQAPLRALLTLLASDTDVHCVDVGAGGAVKGGWHPGTFEVLAGDHSAEPLTLEARSWMSASERHNRLASAYQRVAPLAATAEAALAVACCVRDGDRSPAACANLRTQLERLLTAGGVTNTRADVQDGLGASFLPRFWRTPPDPALGHQLWRPAALAAHELVKQHASLRHRLVQYESAK